MTIPTHGLFIFLSSEATEGVMEALGGGHAPQISQRLLVHFVEIRVEKEYGCRRLLVRYNSLLCHIIAICIAVGHPSVPDSIVNCTNGLGPQGHGHMKSPNLCWLALSCLGPVRHFSFRSYHLLHTFLNKSLSESLSRRKLLYFMYASLPYSYGIFSCTSSVFQHLRLFLQFAAFHIFFIYHECFSTVG